MTGSKIGERLMAEASTSVSLRVTPLAGGGESFEVQARGELQLGLIMGASMISPIETYPLRIINPFISQSYICTFEIKYQMYSLKSGTVLHPGEFGLWQRMCITEETSE